MCKGRTTTKVFLLLALISVGVVVAACAPDCREGRVWCDGDTYQFCFHAENTSVSVGSPSPVHSKQCSVASMELTTEDGQHRAGCLLAEEPCPEGVDSFCIGQEIAECWYLGYPWSDGDGLCRDYCVDSEPVFEAQCGYLPGLCEPDGIQACREDPPNAIYECVDGVWGGFDLCVNDEACVEGDAGTAECI